MDQLQTFLAAVKKYHFWILCVLASLVCLVIVFVSGKKLIAYYDKTKSEISSTDSQLGEVIARPEHPNENWIAAVNKKTAEYKKKAYDGWVRLWQQQKKNIFIWPDLGKEFVGYFSFQMDDPAKPKLGHAKMEELSGYYQNYVTMKLLPAMAQIINADWAGCGDQNPNAGPIRGPRQPVANPQQASAADHPVVWAAEDQQKMCLAYTWDELPSETEIRCAQEDMWVLTALFEAIARANNGAKVSTDTVVRTVQEVSYGRDACVAAPLGENAVRVIRLGPAPGVAAQAAGPVRRVSMVPWIPRRPSRPSLRHREIVVAGLGETRRLQAERVAVAMDGPHNLRSCRLPAAKAGWPIQCATAGTLTRKGSVLPGAKWPPQHPRNID